MPFGGQTPLTTEKKKYKSFDKFVNKILCVNGGKNNLNFIHVVVAVAVWHCGSWSNLLFCVYLHFILFWI